MSLQTSVRLPIDQNSQVVQTLAAGPGALILTATGCTGSGALPAGTIVEIVALTAIHFKFGLVGVTATSSDRILPAGGIAVYAVPWNITDNQICSHIAVLKCAGGVDGLVSVGVMQ